MATSGTYAFNPTADLHLAEAAERAGLAPQGLSGEQIGSAIRSANYLLAEWSTNGHYQWKFSEYTHTVAVDEVSFTLPTGAMGIKQAVIRRDGYDTPISQISREDYRVIPDKTNRGRPDRYFFERRRDDAAGTLPRVFYWQAGENATDQIIMDVYYQIEDLTTLQETLDVPLYGLEAFVARWATALALKYKADRYNILKGISDEAMKKMKEQDRDDAPLIISAQYNRAYGRPAGG